MRTRSLTHAIEFGARECTICTCKRTCFYAGMTECCRSFVCVQCILGLLKTGSQTCPYCRGKPNYAYYGTPGFTKRLAVYNKHNHKPA